MSQVARQTHLEYYREHQIAPVRYDLANMDAHMERRCSLYSKLGLLPLTFNQSRVLEVAAGTGHNSLYLARTMPAKLVLLEPNAIGAQHIREVYSSFHQPHTSPELIRETLEEYSPSEDFDIVLCENWLGTSAHEQSLLRKLAGMVANNGMLVLTTVSPVGFVPNLLRRFLSIYLAPENIDFQKRTEILVEAFGSHLDS
jgi:2-polyprenyl-3-methyl-5-hydroxy-6-metoxy-1,4-benzoquinol methylase